jgi:hypothetical protein
MGKKQRAKGQGAIKAERPLEGSGGLADAHVGCEPLLVALGQAVPIEFILALLEAKCLEWLDDVWKVNLVERDGVDTKPLSRGFARIHHAVGIWPPRHRRKLGGYHKLALSSADAKASLLGSPRRELLRRAEPIRLCCIYKVATCFHRCPKR